MPSSNYLSRMIRIQSFRELGFLSVCYRTIYMEQRDASFSGSLENSCLTRSVRRSHSAHGTWHVPCKIVATNLDDLMNKLPQIGIWWDNGSHIVAFPHLPGESDRATGLCDSDDAHNDLWPDAAIRLGLTDSEEYFSVPRGRVLWSPSKKTSIIYHGNATSTDRLEKIAVMFSLTEWEPRTDIHYMMGDAISDLFDD